jgi:hypothetical protein
LRHERTSNETFIVRDTRFAIRPRSL